MASTAVEELARRHTEQAVDTLADVMLSALEDKDRIRAAEALLDRGHGKPSQAVVHIPATQRQRQLAASLSDDALMDIVLHKQLPSESRQPMITVVPDFEPTASTHEFSQAPREPRQPRSPYDSHGPLLNEDDAPDPELVALAHADDPLFD